MISVLTHGKASRTMCAGAAAVLRGSLQANSALSMTTQRHRLGQWVIWFGVGELMHYFIISWCITCV
ncbi:uncharacterized protein BJ212DRAFT_1376381, partial [Suillus subaureus]